MKRKRVGHTPSAESIELMRHAAQIRHERASEIVHQRVRALISDQEKLAGEGILSDLSLAIVAQRVGIHPQTFYKPRYRALRLELLARFDELRRKQDQEYPRSRKSVAARLAEIRARYDELLEAYRISETDLILANAKLEEAERENKFLKRKIDEQYQLKVVPIGVARKR